MIQQTEVSEGCNVGALGTNVSPQSALGGERRERGYTSVEVKKVRNGLIVKELRNGRCVEEGCNRKKGRRLDQETRGGERRDAECAEMKMSDGVKNNYQYILIVIISGEDGHYLFE